MGLTAKFKLGCVASIFVLVIGGIILTADHGYVDGWLQLEVFMRGCPVDELRIEHFAESNIKFYTTEADYETFNFNLTTGKMKQTAYRSIPFDGFNSMSPFLLYSNPPEGFDQARLEKIKQKLSLLKPPASSYDSYRYQAHLAFWRNGHMCIYSYPREDRAQLQALADELGLPAHFNAHH